MTTPGHDGTAALERPKSPTGAPMGLSLLRSRIQAHVSELSPKQRAIARHVIDNYSQVQFSTAQEVGAVVGASGATVVRFAQVIGYEGFLELRDSLRDSPTSFVTFLDQLSDLALHPFSSEDELVTLVFGREQENLTSTLKLLDLHVLAEVAKYIPTAKRTVLVGTGVGGVVVKLLASHLSRLGLPVVTPSDSVETVISLANLVPGDVVLGVSFWRFARSTSEWLHEAKKRGATTVAIVDSPLYPNADDVDFLLVVSSRNAGHGPSVVAATTLANALMSKIILTDFDRFSRAIQQVDSAYSESHIYLD